MQDGRIGTACQPANSRDRFVAASIARRIVAGQASVAISTANACSVVPPGLVTATRRAAASSSLAASSAPDPATVCRASRRARSGRDALFSRRRFHQLCEQEHIGRSASGNRGHRIEQRLVLNPGHFADRPQQVLAERALRGADTMARASHCDALTHRGRRVRHCPHDRCVLAQQHPHTADGAARHDRQEYRQTGESGVVGQGRRGVLRLHREHDRFWR